jgi:hypothetical protein
VLQALPCSKRQQRFLEAYRLGPVIARAARLAGVNRATVYRWLRQEAFQAALRSAADVFFQGLRERVLAEQAAQKELQKERRKARRPKQGYTISAGPCPMCGQETTILLD